MAELLVRNARIVYPATRGFVVDRGWLLARDGVIAGLAAGDVPVDVGWSVAGRQEIDAAGMTLLPGLLNTHMHLYSMYSRGISTGRVSHGFLDVLQDLWWRLDRSLLKDACWMSATFSGMDSLRCGTTTIVDHHASPSYIAGSLSTLSEALNKIGLRHVLSYEITDRNGIEGAVAGVDENIRFFDEVKGKGGLASSMVGLHASFTVSDATLAILRARVGSRKVGYHVHVAEGAIDEEDSVEKYGKRIVARLDNAGLLSPRSIAVHCVGIDASERELLAKSGTPVVVNTMSNMNNAVGLPAVREMLEAGIQVGIGTDGYTANMFEEFRNTLVGLRHRYEDPAGFWTQVQQAQIETNADIVSRCTGCTVGRLEEGAAADFILVDYASPTPLNSENAFGHMFFGMSADLVDTVVVNGNVAVKGHRVLAVDREDLERESRKVAEAVWEAFDRLSWFPTGV
ncbi:putative aminohydrolase SsnA [Candidatus Cryosericum terrychapinii]|jgi:putative selenium metabolism protein SsnA|uniref:Putative aminohydrolase SsnA n=1 Tax=Candidatus Cryosericum terrychapinii TaxID=2290919 RepID=A0A398CU45_9BACT|nr:putative aminohydrolase SsnA [Candidatus Cryosericum terrychapinii]RIE06142.1 putative aminohydrolase SsnA [Candidatus Cryosericum terrychapinii]